jgi:hypothetical protein
MKFDAARWARHSALMGGKLAAARTISDVVGDRRLNPESRVPSESQRENLVDLLAAWNVRVDESIRLMQIEMNIEVMGRVQRGAFQSMDAPIASRELADPPTGSLVYIVPDTHRGRKRVVYLTRDTAPSVFRARGAADRCVTERDMALTQWFQDLRE